MDIKKQVEAILFTLGAFVSVEEIARHVSASQDDVLKSLQELQEDYMSKDSALTIQKQDNLFKLNIKKEFGFLTNKLLEQKEMDSPTVKTLAVIAYKSPVNQSEIIKIRGNKAYGHIIQLKDSGFITSEKYGRTRLLKLSQQFFDYFDVSEKEIKKQISQVIPGEILTILDDLPKLHVEDEKI